MIFPCLLKFHFCSNVFVSRTNSVFFKILPLGIYFINSEALFLGFLISNCLYSLDQQALMLDAVMLSFENGHLCDVCFCEICSISSLRVYALALLSSRTLLLMKSDHLTMVHGV